MMVTAKPFSEEGKQGTAATSAAFKNHSHDQKQAAVKNGYGLARGIDSGFEELEGKNSGAFEKNKNACRKTIKNFGNGEPRRERDLKISRIPQDEGFTKRRLFLSLPGSLQRLQ
jgi:hypothetical protein